MAADLSPCAHFSCALAVFAKAPVPGYAKTRLIGALGASGAADLARRMIERAMAAAASFASAHLALWCAPDISHPLFTDLKARHGTQLYAQCDGDIGARMRHAFAQHFASHSMPLLLMGSDLPELAATHLAQACAALANGADAVVIPAHDGGYGLIGLSRPYPALFHEMAWSTPDVMAQTQMRAQQAGIRLIALPPLYDIDTPADLARLPTGL